MCRWHGPMLEKLDKMTTALTTLTARLPQQFAGISKEFRFTASEMNRRSQVLFQKYDELDKERQQHRLSLQAMDSRVAGLEKKQSEERKQESRIRLLENWKLKWAAVAATLVFIFQTYVSIRSLLKP